MNPTDNDKSIDALNEDIAEAIAQEPAEQYLTFYMDGEEYGVNILSVQEIRGWEEVTAIPNSPIQVKGVMNLRGTVVPIIDLRLCFGASNVCYEDSTVVIILSIPSESGEKKMGVIVDAVSDVHNFADSQIQPSPELAERPEAKYLMGLGSTEEKMVILLKLHADIISLQIQAKPQNAVA